MNKVICILGPTATGKTELAIQLARQLNGEIVSVDSAMIYRGMDIGTAKPTLDEREGVVHHLIDILEPEESYSAAKFCQDTTLLIEQIFERGNTPILVGGTMMYFNALFKGLSRLPQSNHIIRASIEERALLSSWPQMHEYLSGFDPESAEKIKPNDTRRISRAIEVYEITGENLSNLCKKKALDPIGFPTVRIAIVPENRDSLHERIKKRFDLMLKKGFIDEVKQLYSRPCLKPEMPSMRCVGYKQVWRYLDEEYGYDVMFDHGIIATRQLAKRQLTWLRGMEGLALFHFDDARLQQKVIELVHTENSTVAGDIKEC